MTISSMRRPALMIAAVSLMAIMSPSAHASGPQPSAIARDVSDCITRVSGGRAWLAGTLWALRDQEAGWVGAQVANRNGSYDLGPLQINSWWIPKLASATGKTRVEVAWWLQHDACFNVDAARWIFLSALSSSRDYWKAIGAYHSPTAWRQRRYARAVAAHLHRRFGPAVFDAGRSR